MFELVINGAVACTGTEDEVRAAGADKIRSASKLYEDDPRQRYVVLHVAECFERGQVRSFSNGRADLKIQVRPVAPVVTA